MTAYPELARQYFAELGVSSPEIEAVEIEEFAGKIERLWELIPDNYAVVDISSSGETRDTNLIQFASTIMTTQLVLFENEAKLRQFPEFTESLNQLKLQLLLTQPSKQ